MNCAGATKTVIAILLPNLRGGGAERVSLDLAKAFALMGYQVEFVLMRAEGELLAEAQCTFTIVNLGLDKFRFVPFSFARYLNKHRPQAVIANMWPLTSAAVVGRVLSGYRCKLLLVEHCTLTLQYASWGRLHMLLMQVSMYVTYRWADRVVAVSEGSAVDTASLAGLSDHLVKVVHNPVPQRPLPSAEAQATAEMTWNCPRGERILTVGTLKDQKNHPLLLRAFAKLTRSRTRLMFLGAGDNELRLRALSVELGIADRIIFAGFQTDPSPYYASADLFVLSSDYEGLPTVLIEALSFGVPVVSTDCPSGPAEILEQGRRGRLVPVGDTRALALAMDAALSDKADREFLKRRAADFAPEIAARKYLELLGIEVLLSPR
jgi:glycosyltransferase involved in cell wall biosynthesis